MGHIYRLIVIEFGDDQYVDGEEASVEIMGVSAKQCGGFLDIMFNTYLFRRKRSCLFSN